MLRAISKRKWVEAICEYMRRLTRDEVDWYWSDTNLNRLTVNELMMIHDVLFQAEYWLTELQARRGPDYKVQ